jgi:hypothetical protein
VQLLAVSESPINTIIDPKPVYSHTHMRDIMIKENIPGFEYVSIPANNISA